jgi:hypothetical protein
MTELACLDGPGTAAVSDQLVAVYRAAMAAPPFFESEVETGSFAQAWLVTHDLDTPARALYRSLGARSGGSRRCRRRPGRRRRTW